jgi:hypothetical protein
MGSPFIAAFAIRCGCDRIRSWHWISHIAKDATAFSELFQFIPYFPYSHYRKLNLGAGKNAKTIMESCLVRRDQFDISPQGIIHTPTNAAFTPYPGDPHLGILRMGQFGNKRPNGSVFNFDDVERLMRELWAEYVACNPQLFEI